MKELFLIDKKDYNECAKHFTRSSVRGIICRHGKLAMIHNMKYDFYVFPGGGIEVGENHLDTLIREVAEETGLKVIPETVQEYGFVRTLQNGLYGDILDQTNYYYVCKVSDEINEPKLEDYEKEELFKLEFINAEDAMKINRLIRANVLDPVMPERDRMVLELLTKDITFWS